MRPSNKSRSRNKSGGSSRRNVGNIVNRVFESAGPDGKVRGTPQQIIDKYQALGRDAQVSGDRVAAENYQQHAEHYARLLSEAYRQQGENRPQQPQYERDDQPYREDDGDEAPRRQQNGDGGGLTMIETGSDSESGPVETPEEAAAGKRREEPQPPATEQRKPNGADSGVEAAAGDEAAESAPAPKRSRSRRKPKAEAPEAEAAPQATQAEQANG
jgi:hypothetical protein